MLSCHILILQKSLFHLGFSLLYRTMPRASGDSFARPDNAKDTFSPPYSYPANGVFPSVLHPISPLSPSPWATSGHMNCYNGTAMGQSGPGTFLGPTQGPVTMGAAANPMANTQMQVPVEGFGSHIHSPSINYSPRGTFNEAPTTRYADVIAEPFVGPKH